MSVIFITYMARKTQRRPAWDPLRNRAGRFFNSYPNMRNRYTRWGNKRKWATAAYSRWLAGYSTGKPTIGFPKNQVVRMRYHTNFLLDPGNGGGAQSYTFRANSIYDPDASGVGHQPLGHDQWAQFYSTYTVIGSKIQVKMAKDQQNLGTGESNYLAGILLHDDSTLPTTNIDVLYEQGLSVPSRIGIGNMTSTNIVRLSKKFSAKKFFNIANIKDNQDRIGAVFGEDPPANGDAYFIVYAGVTVAGGDATTAIDCDVTIDYFVLLSDPVALPQS